MTEKSQPEVEQKDNYEVISLFDLIQIILKRKKLIISIFVLCVGLAVAGSFMMEPVYRVNATLYPGWISSDKQGRPIFIESAQNIVSSIKKNAFIWQAYEKLGLGSEKTRFEVKSDFSKDTNLVLLEVDSRFPNDAKNFLQALLEEILEFYRPRSQNRRESLTQEMIINANRINSLKKKEETLLLDRKRIFNQIELAKGRIEVLKESNYRLQNELLDVKSNTNSIIKMRSNIIKGENDDESLTMLLYSSTIQQNLSFIQNLYSLIENNKIMELNTQNQVESLYLKLQDKDIATEQLKTEQENTYAKGQKLKFAKKNIEGMKIVSEPKILPERISPNRTLMVAIAGVLGLFLGVFLAFFKEFWEKQKKLREETF